MTDFQIAPSILSADLARLGEEISSVLEADANMVHVDVMDNHYVPNLTIGPVVCEALRNYGIKAPLDVHLMVKPVDRLIDEFAKAGATYISIHAGATEHLDRSLQVIRDHGCKAGLALNPATPLNHLTHVLDKLDMVVLMSVNPGFGGQQLIESVYEKIHATRELIDRSSHPIRLEVDGGVKVNNIAKLASAGADTFVVGSAIFNSSDYQKTMQALRKELKGV